MGQAGSGFDLLGSTRNMVSVLCALGAAALLASRWPALRQMPLSGLGVALLLAVLCAFMPNLGAACLCTAACVRGCA